MIYEKDTFEETVEEVKKYDPLLIVAGNERGVILANKLSHELGLLGNPIENLDAMTLKDEMQNRLAEHGLRYIKGKVIRSLEEAIEFYDSEDLKGVVLKPVYSCASTGVRICLNRDEIEAVKMLFNAVNHYGDKNEELIIQEYINGEEYIVNTVSNKGVHRVTLVWKYNKIRDSDGTILCDSSETIDELSVGEAEMIEYAYKVADAMGIQYGPVHGEYMIDEKGPILIEVNCRPCGANMPARFLDRISGQHETDSILDAYLKPDRFYEELKKPYELYAKGVIKLFIVPHDLIARSSPMASIGNKLKSYHSSSLTNMNYNDMFFRKTEDLHSSGGYVFLVHENKSIVYDNLNFLRNVEKNAFSLIFSEDSLDIELKDDEVYLDEIKPLIKQFKKYATGLFVTDQFIDDMSIFQINYEKINEIKGKFEFIIINLNKSLIGLNEVEKANILLDIFSKVMVGGIIFIPKNTYEFMSNGRDGVESLIRILDYKIELPPYYLNDVVIASKR